MTFKSFPHGLERRGRVVFLPHAADDGAEVFNAYDGDEAEKACLVVGNYLEHRLPAAERYLSAELEQLKASTAAERARRDYEVALLRRRGEPSWHTDDPRGETPRAGTPDRSIVVTFGGRAVAAVVRGWLVVLDGPLKRHDYPVDVIPSLWRLDEDDAWPAGWLWCALPKEGP